jgi:hypothetical protein
MKNFTSVFFFVILLLTIVH